MRGREKENIEYYSQYETLAEKRRRLELQRRIVAMKRENEVLEAKVNALVEELTKLTEMIKTCCGQLNDKHTTNPNK